MDRVEAVAVLEARALTEVGGVVDPAAVLDGVVVAVARSPGLGELAGWDALHVLVRARLEEAVRVQKKRGRARQDPDLAAVGGDGASLLHALGPELLAELLVERHPHRLGDDDGGRLLVDGSAVGRAQHPRRLGVRGRALSHEVDGRRVGGAGDRAEVAERLDVLVRVGEFIEHFRRGRLRGGWHRRRGVRDAYDLAFLAQPFGDVIRAARELVVLLAEQLVELRERRPVDVPVEELRPVTKSDRLGEDLVEHGSALSRLLCE